MKKNFNKVIFMTNPAFFDLCGFDAQTKSLCAIYCQNQAEQLSSWLSEADFDKLPSDLTCMAAVSAAAADFKATPQALVPRLRGLIKYVHALNSGMTAGMLSLANALHQDGIRLLLLEDTALALTAPEGGQRQLWQLRIGVAKKDYDKAVSIAHQNGWEGEASPWAATLRQGVTRQLTLFPFAENSYLWENASVFPLGNVPLLCPEPAAILMGLCQLGFRTLTKKAPRAAMVHWVMDMKQLLARFNEAHWQRALQLARQEKACFHVGLLLHIYETFSGGAVGASAFCTLKDARKTARLLQAFRACPDEGKKLKRVYLLHRLRRPDSLAATLGLLTREAIKKLKH